VTETPDGTGSSPEAFVTDYYAHLPGDTRGSWSMLSPSYQASTNYGRYRGFWATISSVTVTGAEPAGDGAVDVSLTYTEDSGRSQTEVRRIFLEQTGGRYLIRDDEIVG